MDLEIVPVCLRYPLFLMPMVPCSYAESLINFTNYHVYLCLFLIVVPSHAEDRHVLYFLELFLLKPSLKRVSRLSLRSVQKYTLFSQSYSLPGPPSSGFQFISSTYSHSFFHSFLGYGTTKFVNIISSQVWMGHKNHSMD